MRSRNLVLTGKDCNLGEFLLLKKVRGKKHWCFAFYAWCHSIGFIKTGVHCKGVFRIKDQGAKSVTFRYLIYIQVQQKDKSSNNKLIVNIVYFSLAVCVIHLGFDRVTMTSTHPFCKKQFESFHIDSSVSSMSTVQFAFETGRFLTWMCLQYTCLC